MARKAKPVWFKPPGGKWHRDPMLEGDGSPVSDADVEDLVSTEGHVLFSKCGSYGLRATTRTVRSEDCEIRRSKPRNNVCKNCDR